MLHRVLRGLFIHAALPLHRKHGHVCIPVLLVPTSTADCSAMEDIKDLLNASQGIFEFFVTNSMGRIIATLPFHRAKLSPNAEKPSGQEAIRSYVHQDDYLPQLDSFLHDRRNLGLFAQHHEYRTNETLTIVVGMERFMWDRDEVTLEGNFEEDGWTALYNDDESNQSALRSDHNNICAISIDKFLVDENDLRRPILEKANIDLARVHSYQWYPQRVYLVSNIAHFLLARCFLITSPPGISRMHPIDCIMSLNWSGGLGEAMSNNYICSSCFKAFQDSGLASRAAREFSAREIINAVLAMKTSLTKLLLVTKAAEASKKAIFFTTVAVLLALSIAVISAVETKNIPYLSVQQAFEITSIYIDEHRLIKPVLIVCCALLLISSSSYILCKWIRSTSTRDLYRTDAAY